MSADRGVPVNKKRSKLAFETQAAHHAEKPDAVYGAVVPPIYQTTSFVLSEGLGGGDSLVTHPALMTHVSVPPEIRKSLGIEDSLIRLSAGIEDVDDLVVDLDQAMAL
jgi:cystathionine beta-lyase/cystathionine gamma-synthase